MKIMKAKGSVFSVRTPSNDMGRLEVVLTLKGKTEGAQANDFEAALTLQVSRAQVKNISLGDIFEVTLTKAEP